MIQEAITNFQIFNSTNGKFQSLEDNIKLVGCVPYEFTKCCKCFKTIWCRVCRWYRFAILLSDEMMEQVFKEFPNTLVPEGVIK